MKRKSTWLTLLCVVPLFLVAGGCSDDDDNPIQLPAVDEEQAEAAVKEAVDFLVEFPEQVSDLLEALNAEKAGDTKQQEECVPLPGIDREFFCDTASAGEVCPGTGPLDSDWNFDTCIGENGSLFDGSVSVTESGDRFDLDFDLVVDGSSLRGALEVLLGQLGGCVSFTFTNLEITESLRIVFTGSKQLCIPGGLSGDIDAEITADFVRRFRMEIEFVEDQLLPVVIILDGATQEPLYSCTYSILQETATCTSVQ